MESAEIRKQAELKEHRRHNMAIERLEQDRINMWTWADKQEELQYNQELYEQLQHLHADNVTYEDIAVMFPELVHVFPKEEKEMFENK